MTDQPTSETKTPKKGPPLVALFLAQPAGTLVGGGRPFRDIFELCKWAHEECGYEGVTAPAGAPFVDIPLALKNPDYRAELLGKYEACGTPLRRLEGHVIGQRMLMHPAQRLKFRGFAPSGFRDATVEAHEKQAAAEMRDAITVNGLLGFRHFVAFPGNRAWTVGQYPWSANPKGFRRMALLLLLSKWQDVLELATDTHQKIGFEAHPVQDLHSSRLIHLLRQIAEQVAPKAAKAIYENFDASHRVLIGDRAEDDAAYSHGRKLLAMCHLKDGKQLVQPGGSLWGDFEPEWSKSRRRFQTFGTGDANWGEILPILHTVHEAQEEGMDFVVEGECSRFPNMQQALRIGATNALEARNKYPLHDCNEVEALASDGGNWEEFCFIDESPEDLLRMNQAERAQVRVFDSLLQDQHRLL